jgi:hypothetical protein
MSRSIFNTFLLYWIGQGHFTGTRGQVFLANPTEYKHDRVIAARRSPRTYHPVARELCIHGCGAAYLFRS